MAQNPNEDTQWNDVLRSKGIIPEKQKVIYQGVLTTKPFENREFQFVYICSLFSSTMRQQNGSKLKFLGRIGEFNNFFLHFCDFFQMTTFLITAFELK